MIAGQRVGIVLSAMLASFAVAGCTGSLLDSDLPPRTSYVLAPAPAAETASAAATTQADLSIGRPDLAPGLDTDRIAVLEGRQLDYYRGARWGAEAGEVVQALLVGSFEDQRLFRSVSAEQARVAADYVLDIEVRDFQAEYTPDNSAPAAHVMIVARLIRIADRQLVATLAAEARNRADDNRMSAVVAAFEAAAQQVALELAQKAAAAIGAEPAAAQAAPR